MSDDKELAYKLIAKYGEEWVKYGREAIHNMQEDLKKLPKEMRKSYEIALERDKKFLLEVVSILKQQNNKESPKDSSVPYNNPTNRFATPKKIPELYPGVFTESSIRWLIFNEKQNGFSCCVRRLGRKVLIDLELFEEWIKSQ